MDPKLSAAAPSTFTVTPMSGPFGAHVRGFDIESIAEPAIANELAAALYAHKVLVVCNQDPTIEQFVELSRAFGVPDVSAGRDSPVMIIHNSPETPEPERDGAMHWHSDFMYEENPASVTLLHTIEAPTCGNETLFADSVAAYDALPPSTKALIRDLETVHDPKGGRVMSVEEKRGAGTPEHLPLVTHPLVIRHFRTGAEALFGYCGTVSSIVGLDDTEGLSLLRRLKAHALQPRFRQVARAAPGTILMWDNYSVVHSASPTTYDDSDGERRLIRRISTRREGRRNA